MANFADLWESGNDAYAGLKSDFASRLQAANDAWQAQTGKPIQINSGYRTPEKQIKLWNSRGSNPNLVAKPGTSLHETGEAADIPADIPDTFLNQFGLHRPYGKKDPVHVEAMQNFTPKTASTSTEEPATTFADLWESTPVGNEKPKQQKAPVNLKEAAVSANQTMRPIKKR